jgi:transcriptional antiterminator NusG
MIWTIRTTVGRENAVLETLASKIKNTGAKIATLLHPAELKGYIFIEGEPAAIESVVGGIPHVRGLIRKEITIAELKKFLEMKAAEIKVNRGDIIEIVGGPFKNERGRVTRVDTAKNEITIELLEAAIPIPITVALDMVKLIESAEKAAAKTA